MKKIILSAALVLCATSAFASYEAVDTATGKTLGTTQTTVAKGSKGVMIEYLADTTNNGQGYVLGSYHSSGTQTYASSSGDTKIYKQDGTGVAVPTGVPTGSNTADFTGWTAM